MALLAITISLAVLTLILDRISGFHAAEGRGPPSSRCSADGVRQ
jgi:hypothetical protein